METSVKERPAATAPEDGETVDHETEVGIVLPKWFIGILASVLILMGGAIVNLLIFQGTTSANRWTSSDAHKQEVRWQEAVMRMSAVSNEKFDALKDMIFALDRRLPESFPPREYVLRMEAQIELLQRAVDKIEKRLVDHSD